MENFIYLFILILCHPLLSQSYKFLPFKRNIQLNMNSEIKQSDIFKSSAKKIIASIAVAISISGDFNARVMAVDTSASTLTPIEENIVKLEKAENRADVVQSLADLFESAGTQTLKARTKYKYVSILEQIRLSLKA